MAAFPKLTTGAVTQYPSGRRIESETVVLRYLDGTEQRFRNVSGPIQRWALRLADVTTEELHRINQFFISCQGQFASFSFTDPWTGTEHPDCSFESPDFLMASFAEGRAAGTVVIRSNRV